MYIFIVYLMLVIPLYAANSDFTSSPAPFSFSPSNYGGCFGKVCRVLKCFPLPYSGLFSKG